MSSLRRRPCSPSAASPLDDDDLLSELLLRLPPQPSSLPRASAVCKSWRHLVSDPRFSRRFRLHHRRNPPLLGFFETYYGPTFQPTRDAPNRVPPRRFSLQRDDGDRFISLGCRHGLVLMLDPQRKQVLVWDPVTGLKHRLAIPPGLDAKGTLVNGAVVHPAGDVHFQVVLVAADDEKMQHRRALARVYSSETGVWSNLISTPLPPKLNGFFPYRICTSPAVLVGASLCWILAGGATDLIDFDEERHILEFDLEDQSLTVMPTPVDMFGKYRFTVMRAEGGGLGVLFVSESDFTVQLWKRKMDCDGVAKWGFERTIDLDKLLSLNLEEENHIKTLQFAEENNLVVVSTVIGVYTIHLESLQFKKLSETNAFEYGQPFECVYTAETCIGGGHGAADLLQNT